VPSQIRALRLKSDVPRQPDLAHAAEMHQSRISMLETAGANPTLSTLSAIAAALKVGLKVEFVPFSQMLSWENGFSQDDFNPVRIDEDQAFLRPAVVTRTVNLPTVWAPDFTGQAYREQWRQVRFAFDKSQACAVPEVSVIIRSEPILGEPVNLVGSYFADIQATPSFEQQDIISVRPINQLRH